MKFPVTAKHNEYVNYPGHHLKNSSTQMGGMMFDEQNEAVRNDRDHRARTFKAGIVSYQNNSISHDCTVKNLTDSGAMLRFETAEMVPSQFALVIPVDGTRVDCETCWRKDNLMGVKFVGNIERDDRNARIQAFDLHHAMPKKNSILRKN